MRTSSIVVSVLLILIFPSLAISQAVDKNIARQYESNKNKEWVLVLDDPRPARLQGWVRRGYNKTSVDYRDSLELERFGKAVAVEYKMELRDQWFIPSLGVYCLVVRFNEDHEKTISQLKQNESVQWVQPSNEFELLSTPRTSSQPEIAPNITTDLSSAIDNKVDGSGVVIAIVDSAIDDSHQDLAGQIDKVGDFVASSKKAKAGESHGTAIAGVMVADRNTRLGVAGVAPAATLQAYRGCWETSRTQQTNCNTLSLARALDAVLRSKADILNLSLSGPQDTLLERLLQRVIDRGTIVVTAFDPSRPSSDRFPSEREGVLVVRAKNLDKQHTRFFTAPGARVVTSPGNRYDFMHGHSVATAYTSGLLALRKQVLDSTKVRDISENEWRKISRNSAAEDLLNDILSKS